jgi:hypothetical protein
MLFEVKPEPHRSLIKENICRVFDEQTDRLFELLPKTILNILLLYKCVDQDKINGDLRQQEKFSEIWQNLLSIIR